ncbi:MAG: hypothetical protein EZS28_042498 [Streblomastix strix]|uniref:Uncharacterized protein n=1 Tax=Streblomastix strix TaxID=222440 RepID=A0A5J4TX51_9EUKA|nr:MAG: hypothetical protein EZS28_042498 [Streblomastix strix]
MIYIGWTGDYSNYSAVKTIMISDAIFTGCCSVTAGMRVVAQNINYPQKYFVIQRSNANNPYAEQIEPYSYGLATYDEVHKHGLIYLLKLTGGVKSGISQFSI